MKTSITVAIPALNEEKNIESTILTVLGASELVREVTTEIIIVDDGSSDNTSAIVKRIMKSNYNVKLLRNEENIGLGASIRKVIEVASSEKFIFIPGDNDIPIETLTLLFRNAKKADIVMCYFLNDECRGRVRFIVSNLFMLIYTTIFDLYVQYINGPAIYPTNELKKLHLASTRFSIVAEINVKLLRQSLTFLELASFRQTGLHGSTSFSFKSLYETFVILLNTIYEVFVSEKQKFSGRPKRVIM
jgi:glycosyltransferase involved in cell wall biosynthesis